MKKEELFNLTAVCGIDCFNCQFYVANIAEFFANMPAEQKKAFDAQGATPEKMACNGCRKDGCKMIAGSCATKKCAAEKNVLFCYEGKDFPCSKLQPLADRASTAPHNLKVYNLMAIKNRGIEEWAKESKLIRMKYYKGQFKIGAGPQLAE